MEISVRARTDRDFFTVVSVPFQDTEKNSVQKQFQSPHLRSISLILVHDLDLSDRLLFGEEF